MASKLGENDSYLLEWANFSKVLSCQLEGFQNNGLFTDVSLISGSAGNRIFRSHKLILSMGSPYFKSLFEKLPQGQNPVIVLNEIDDDVLENILHFIYLGKVNVPQEKLESFLQVAEKFSVRGLTQENKINKSFHIKPSSDAEERERISNLSKSNNKKKRRYSQEFQPDESKITKIQNRTSSSEIFSEVLEPLSLKTEPLEIESNVQESETQSDQAFQSNFIEQTEDSASHITTPRGNSPPSTSQSGTSKRGTTNPVMVLFAENNRCHFCRILCPDHESLINHLESVHMPKRHALCENCENFFHVCAIQRHKAKCAESYRSKERE